MKTVFVEWAKFASRSASLASAMDGTIINLSSPERFRKVLNPVLYVFKTLITLFILFREKPDVIFATNPPLFTPLTAYLYSILKRIPYAIDSHSAAFDSWKWKWLTPLHRFLAKKAEFSIVTTTHWANLITSWNAKTIILDDPPLKLENYNIEVEVRKRFHFGDQLNICYVNTFAGDEPLDKVIGAAKLLNDVRFFITGNLKRAPSSILSNKLENVLFTGYIDNDSYFSLLSEVDVVMCLTDRENTMQNGGMEAVAVEKPFITSNTDLLRKTFSKGTVHVENSVEGIVTGVRKIRKNLREYAEEMKILKRQRDALWMEKKKEIIKMCMKNSE